MSLLDQIRIAQRDAGESAVIANLRRQGLIPDDSQQQKPKEQIMTDDATYRKMKQECERLKELANKALDDIDAEAEAFEAMENAQRNFSDAGPEVRTYGIALVRASKSSKALRDAARAKP